MSKTHFLSLLYLGIALSGCRNATSTGQNPTPAAKLGAAPVAAAKPTGPPEKAPIPAEGVRGLYLTGWSAGSSKKMAKVVDLLNRTELNAVVIDVRDDGEISYEVDVPIAREAGAIHKMIPDVDKLMATLKKHNIYSIARITCFRDKVLPKKRPDLAIQTPDGKAWKDPSGHMWLNPYKKENWDYTVDVAKDAIKRGFNEIQFDYIRFPSEGNLQKIRYPGMPKGMIRRNQIEAFIKYAAEKVRAEGAWVSADVFGLVSITKDDMGIGQTATNIARHIDYLCPMVYPSHYAYGEYGMPDPNKQPYKTVLLSVGDEQKKFKAEELTTCKLRPWIQDFSLRGVRYGAAEVKAQRKALQELGIKEFLLWNAGNRYSEAALEKATPTQAAQNAAPPDALSHNAVSEKQAAPTQAAKTIQEPSSSKGGL